MSRLKSSGWSRQSGVGRLRHVKWWAAALAGASLLATCIKREPVVKEPEAVAAPDGRVEAPGPTGKSGKSGKYGKVPAVDVLGGAGVDAFELRGVTARVATHPVEVTGQSFRRALRAEIKESSPNPWDVQLVATSRSEVQSGDVLLASFWFRAEYVLAESGEAEAELNFELNHPAFENNRTQTVKGALAEGGSRIDVKI
jgi:hypothetical protein